MTPLLKPAVLAALLCASPAPLPAHVPPACTLLMQAWSARTAILERTLGTELERGTDEMRIRLEGGDATEAQAALQDAEIATRIAEMFQQESFLAMWDCVRAE